MPEVLFVLAIVLAVITVVGHLVWLILEAIVRALLGVPKKQADEARWPCPFCKNLTPVSRNRCNWCGRDLRGFPLEELTDLEAFRRELRRLMVAGCIERGEADRLLETARLRREDLLEPKRIPTSSPAPPSPALEPTEKTVEPPEEAVKATEEAVKATEEAVKATEYALEATEYALEATEEVPASPFESAVPLELEPSGDEDREAALVPPAAISPLPETTKPAPPAEPRPPEPPPKTWLESLSEFLEERNIRWAEMLLVVAGLLIVGPSIALVTSNWETLERIPVFQFCLIVGATSAVLGMGLYIYHRLKLESTGRAILTIATLGVPLNFLAMASLSRGNWTFWNVGWEMASLAGFVGLIYYAAGVLVPRGRWFEVVAVVGNSGLLLLLARVPGIETRGWLFLAAGLFPVAVYVAAVGGALRNRWARGDLDASRAGALYMLLGTASFAAMCALGVLVKRGAEVRELGTVFDLLAPLAALASVPLLATGLTTMRGTRRDASMAIHGTVGTLLALVGLSAMLGALAMAWPQPLAVLVVGLFSAAVLVWVAFSYRLFPAHAGASACVGLVYLVGVRVLLGHVACYSAAIDGGELTRLLIDRWSGAAMVGLVALFGMAAAMLARRGYFRHAVHYLGAAIVAAMLSLAIVTFHGARGVIGGIDATPVAMTVYGIHALAGLLGNVWLRKRLLTYLSLALLVGTTLWGMWWLTAEVQPVWATVLALEALAMGLLAAWLPGFTDREPGTPWNRSSGPSPGGVLVDVYRIPLLHVAEILAPVALAVGVGTAWLDFGVYRETLTPVATGLFVAALYFLLAWGYRSAERTWVGSTVVLVGLVHTLAANFPVHSDGCLSFGIGLLAHATFAGGAGVVLSIVFSRRGTLRWRDEVRRAFVKPLGETGLVSSTFAALVLASASWNEAGLLAALLCWLAAIWLCFAWTNRWPLLVAASQAVLTLAVLMATTAWLRCHPWEAGGSAKLLDPRSLHVYGIGLGLLTLGWVVVRIVLGQSREAKELLDRDRVAVDRFVGYGVVVCQFLLLVVHLVPGCLYELTGNPSGGAAATVAWGIGPGSSLFGASAWLLLGVLTVALAVALWHRWQAAELAMGLLLAATVPCLVAGPFFGSQSVASALRWGLAILWIAGAGCVFGRRTLLAGCQRIGGKVDVGPFGPRLARVVLLGTGVFPVLAMTILASLAQLGGTASGGPAAGSFFFRMGPEVSYLMPLVLVLAGLVGLALRERSAGYAFSAGLVANMAVMLGYLLGVTLSGGRVGTHEVVTVLQLFTITAAAWAAGWLVGRRWVDVWREGPGQGSSAILMRLQFGLAVAGLGLLWVPALGSLVLLPARSHAWTIEAGSWLGWVALASVVGAAIYRRIQMGLPIRPNAAGLVGLVALGLVACSVRSFSQIGPAWGPAWGPEWGYRTLMLAWAMYALCIVSATWWVATIRTLPGAKGPPQVLIGVAARWVSVAGLLAVFLGLKAAFCHSLAEDRLWGAAAIALASAASATMSVWRRREGWALAAALGVNVAASLSVWYFERALPLDDWWILLVQANVIASAAVALVWLGARKRLYVLHELSLRTSPLLAVQTSLAAVGLGLLVAPPIVQLLKTPASLPGWANPIATVPGWIALGLTALAAAWHLRQIAPREMFHVAGGLGLALGAMVACSTSQWFPNAGAPDWLAYHVLMTTWAAAGLVVLGVGMGGRKVRLTCQVDPEQPLAEVPSEPVFSTELVRDWVTILSGAAVVLALIFCLKDPQMPWWSVRAIVAGSVAAGVLAMWLRLPGYVYLSGLLINAAGMAMWITWASPSVAGAVFVNVLCLAIGSALWSLIRLAYPGGVPPLRVDGQSWPFASVGVGAGLCGLGLLTTISTIALLTGGSLSGLSPDRLGWAALGAVAVASTLGFWDRPTRFPLQAWCGIGLVALGMALDVRGLSRMAFCWTAGQELALLVLLFAVLAYLLGKCGFVWRALRMPIDPPESGADWFSPVQVGLLTISALLGVWVSIDFAMDLISRNAPWLPAGRMAGPPTFGALLAAAFLMARVARRGWTRIWQQTTLALSTLLLAGLGWALLDAEWLTQQGASPWLHRCVILLVASVAMTLVSGIGLRAIVSRGSIWLASGRRMVAPLGGASLLLLIAVLAQEVFLFKPEVGTPMAISASMVVTLALVGLIAAGLAFAVVARWDPFGLSERGRTAYVYAAEALGALTGFHLWLTMPWLFSLGIVDDYWMLLVIVGAFAGAGLSEWFHRRGLPVLSEPLERTALLLPLLPALVFWLPITAPGSGFAGASPALWFLVALFYGVMAVTRRSAWYLPLAALVAGNIGFFVLWTQRELGIMERPQLWLIPVGLSILVAEYLNRRRLTPAQGAGFRYAALSVIYLSSTSEFLRELGDSVVLPLVLILFSVIGVLAGVVFRIRSYIYLGVTFLVLVLVSMIWYAAVDRQHTWVFSLCCIGLGTAILMAYAVYEKHRARILAAFTRFRTWQR